MEGTAEEAGRLLNNQGQPSDEPEPASELSYPVGGGAGSAADGRASPFPSKGSNVSLQDVEKEAGKLLNNQGQPSDEPDASKLSDHVGGGAGSEGENGASPSLSEVPNVKGQPSDEPDARKLSGPVDGGAGSATDNGASPSTQSDTSKKSARPYNIASLLLLGGGVGCGVLALSLYYTCAVSALTAGIIAGVGVPLFLIAAAIVYSCGPTTSIENDGFIKQVAPSGAKEAVPSAS